MSNEQRECQCGHTKFYHQKYLNNTACLVEVKSDIPFQKYCACLVYTPLPDSRPRICLCGGYIGSHDKKNETCSHLGRNKKGGSYRYVCLCSRYEAVSDDVHNVHYAPIPDGVMPTYQHDEKTVPTDNDPPSDKLGWLGKTRRAEAFNGYICISGYNIEVGQVCLSIEILTAIHAWAIDNRDAILATKLED